MGETFAFDRLRVETNVHAPGPLLMENFWLEPGKRPLESIARLGAYSYTASFCAFQIGRAQADIRRLESELVEIAHEESEHGVRLWGASALASDGVVVRGLSTTARGIPATLARFWTAARRFLTAEDPVPPRKLK